MQDDVLIVGIAGGTASGKSTLARKVVDMLGEAALLIQHDRYYLDVPDPATFRYASWMRPVVFIVCAPCHPRRRARAISLRRG